MAAVVATKRLGLTFAAMALVSGAATASPLVVKIAGTIMSSAGAPQTAAKDLQVKLYAASTGGSALWTSSVYNTTLDASGQFSVALDASTGSPSLVQALTDLAPTDEAWFQFVVDSAAANGVMTTPLNVVPRIRSGGASYVLAARNTDGLQGVLMSITAATNTQVLTFNNGTQRWTPTNPDGKDSTFATEAATRTTGTMNLYVRTDGSDSTCTGLANASSASAPACAFATPQKAINMVPDFVLHAVTVNVVTGTYRQSTTGATLMNIIKSVSPSASLLVQTSGGAVTFSGATSGAPTTPAGKYGIVVQAPSRGVTINGFSTVYFTADGIRIEPSASVALNGVTSTNNTSSGLIVIRATADLGGYNVFSSNGYDGLFSTGGHVTLSGATVQTNSNTSYGTIASDVGSIITGASTLIISNSNAKDGISAINMGVIAGAAKFAVTSNSQIGLSAGPRGMLQTSGNTTATSNGYYATHSWGPSHAQYDGNFTASGSGWTDIVASEKGLVWFNKAVTVTTGTPPAWSVHVDAVWKGSVIFNNGASDAVSFTGTTSTAQAWSPVYGGMIKTYSAGSITLSTYQYQGIWANGGLFIDVGTGTRSISGTSSGNKAWMEEQSLYRKGGFPAYSGCLTGSRCN